MITRTVNSLYTMRCLHPRARALGPWPLPSWQRKFAHSAQISRCLKQSGLASVSGRRCVALSMMVSEETLRSRQELFNARRLRHVANDLFLCLQLLNYAADLANSA